MLHINDIFQSIAGEVNTLGQGTCTSFIRFQNCNCRCFYCDSKETRDKDGGSLLSEEQIMQKVRDYGNKHVCITGGEPLLQNINKLVRLLKSEQYFVSIESNGTQSLGDNDADCFIIDYKLEYPELMNEDAQVY